MLLQDDVDERDHRVTERWGEEEEEEREGREKTWSKQHAEDFTSDFSIVRNNTFFSGLFFEMFLLFFFLALRDIYTVNIVVTSRSVRAVASRR